MESEFQQFSRKLLSYLGSFWDSVYKGQDQVGQNEVVQYLTGLAYLQKQAEISIQELDDSISIAEIDPFREQYWYWCEFRQSDRIPNLIRYGDGLYYGKQPAGAEFPEHWIAQYGDEDPVNIRYIYPLPQHMVDVYKIFDHILYPSVEWTKDEDYWIEELDGQLCIVFQTDPFTVQAFPQKYQYDELGNIVDTSVGMWMFRSQWDYEDVWNRFGYVLGIYAQSSEFYRDFVKFYQWCLETGTSITDLYMLLSLMSGIPVTLDDTEVIREIDDSAGITIRTDKNTYSFSDSVNPIVAVGDTVHRGDPLTDALMIMEFTDDAAYSYLPGLVVGPNMNRGDYAGELLFPNESSDLEIVGQDENGKTIVQFTVHGFTQDVEAFWSKVHQRGLQTKTLAERLDTRDNPTTQPTEEFLPSTVNPMQMLVEHVMGNNLYVIYVKTSELKSDAIGMRYLEYLRPILNPETTYVVHTEVNANQDTYDLSPATETQSFFGGHSVADVATCNIISAQTIDNWFVVRDNITAADTANPPTADGIDVSLYTHGQLMATHEYTGSGTPSDSQLCCTLVPLYYDETTDTWAEGDAINLYFGETAQFVSLNQIPKFSVRVDYLYPDTTGAVILHAWSSVGTLSVVENVYTFTR